MMTVGDETYLPCPTCNKEMYIQDITTDGCLVPGFKDTCEHCKSRFEIYDVEYSATVWAKAV